WRCLHMANPASCAFSIISGALIPGCEAACSDAGGDKLLQQRRDALANSSWPYSTLNLADMWQLQQQHGQT
ncbi:hypothetical protein Q604_UNBC03978G0001, partial [human gut metagenome]